MGSVSRELKHRARRIGGDERGVAAIEYALLCALIALAALGGIHGLGDSLTSYWDKVAQAVADSAGTGGASSGGSAADTGNGQNDSGSGSGTGGGTGSGAGNGNAGGNGHGHGNGNGNGRGNNR